MNTEYTNQRAYKEIAEKILRLIHDENIQVGDRLPSEREISAILNTSRTLVREAFIMLEIYDLVEVKKGSGIYLKSLNTYDFSLKEIKGFQAYDIGPFELLQARQYIESSIASLAATHVTKMDIKHLHELLEKGQKKENSSDEYDQMFHLAIANISKNSILIEINKTLWEQRNHSPMWLKLHDHIPEKGLADMWYEDHQTILHALQRKDSEGARYAMWQHIEKVKEHLFALSDTNAPDFDGYLFP